MDSPDASQPIAHTPDFPRFGIRHMLLWAVCLAVDMPMAKLAVAQYAGGSAALFIALSIVGSIQTSAAILVLPIFVSRRWRGHRFPEYPGERYWLIQGIVMPIWTVLMAGLLRNLWDYSALLFAWPTLLACALLVHAAWRVGRGPWRWGLAVAAAISLRELLPLLMPWLDLVLPHDIMSVCKWLVKSRAFKMADLLPASCALIGIVVDHRRGRRYPWTHWWGVALLLATVLQVLWMFVKWS